MAVKIRLRRMGTKKVPFYRVVVADERTARDGRFLESLGTYDPARQGGGLKVDAEKTLRWLRKGAQPTDTVATDTVAWMKSTGLGGSVMAFRSSGGAAPTVRMTPYATEDGWAVAPDGRIALVRAADYHVEWIGSDRRRTAGPQISYTPVKIGKPRRRSGPTRWVGR